MARQTVPVKEPELDYGLLVFGPFTMSCGTSDMSCLFKQLLMRFCIVR